MKKINILPRKKVSAKELKRRLELIEVLIRVFPWYDPTLSLQETQKSFKLHLENLQPSASRR